MTPKLKAQWQNPTRPPEVRKAVEAAYEHYLLEFFSSAANAKSSQVSFRNGKNPYHDWIRANAGARMVSTRQLSATEQKTANFIVRIE